MNFLSKFIPKMIIIEYPSQPLFDCLHLDAEIFLLHDPLHPYEGQAIDELRRRVHFAESIEEIISKMDLYLQNQISPKRDNTFYGHYVYKEKRKEHILKLIHSLI